MLGLIGYLFLSDLAMRSRCERVNVVRRGCSLKTLQRRVRRGGRKGRSAKRRLNLLAKLVYRIEATKRAFKSPLWRHHTDAPRGRTWSVDQIVERSTAQMLLLLLGFGFGRKRDGRAIFRPPTATDVAKLRQHDRGPMALAVALARCEVELIDTDEDKRDPICVPQSRAYLRAIR